MTSAQTTPASQYTWAGRFSEPMSDLVKRYTASVDFDKRMWRQDIRGSLAHASMLARQNIISATDLADIQRGMAQIVSEIESGHFEWSLDLEDVHLNIEKRLTTLVGDAGKRLRMEVDTEALPCQVRGDATRFTQALLNLASNAVKFTEVGKVTLSLRVMERRGGRLRVRAEVRDSGIGVPADVLPKLFMPFEQGDASNTRKYGGTGLGLAITRRLAELMGGEAGASSTAGVGSTFWFTAWLDVGQASVATEQPVAPPDRTGAIDEVRAVAGRLTRAMETVIEDRCHAIIALQTPMVRDLRFVISVQNSVQLENALRNLRRLHSVIRASRVMA